MQSKKLTITGVVILLAGALCLYISLAYEFWYERVWLIVTFVIGIALLIRGFVTIFFFKKILFGFLQYFKKIRICSN